MAYLFRFYRLGFILKNDSKNFQEIHLLSKISLKVYSYVVQLSRFLSSLTCVSNFCSLSHFHVFVNHFFIFFFSAVRFLRLPADSSYILANFISFVNTFFEVFLFFEEGNFSPVFFQIFL